MDSDFVVPEAYMIWISLRKRIQDSKYKTMHKNEYLEWENTKKTINVLKQQISQRSKFRKIP